MNELNNQILSDNDDSFDKLNDQDDYIDLDDV